jgi:DNA polymerase, archaea type
MYEALLAAGRRHWRVGERVRVYRARSGWALVPEDSDPRDYEIDHYVRALRVNYASRLARALTMSDSASLFADPDQPSLFEPDFSTLRSRLTRLPVDI